jgi:hypothetical protein
MFVKNGQPQSQPEKQKFSQATNQTSKYQPTSEAMYFIKPTYQSTNKNNQPVSQPTILSTRYVTKKSGMQSGCWPANQSFDDSLDITGRAILSFAWRDSILNPQAG